ncbi:MAG: hypothetical protein J5I50_01915 [Chitinophagaceae bacterium]|nr:hypothetical protein [Chitinophagaceae bacterium]
MKIDQLLLEYLLKYGELRLHEIGVFKLKDAVHAPDDPSKPIVIPSDAISFKFDPKTPEDADLVAYISESTGKITPLASADLDSYLSLRKEFLNIGKPMILANIGTLEKASSGELTFKGGEYVVKMVDTDRKVPEIEEAEPDKDDSFSDLRPSRRRTGRIWLYLFLVIILGLIAWALWKYDFDQDKTDGITQTETEAAPAITPPATAPAPADSIAQPAESQREQATEPVDSTQTQNLPSTEVTPQVTPSTTGGFKIIVGVYRLRSTAERRIEDLKLVNRDNLSLMVKDSVNYWVLESFNRPLSDTTVVRDSVRIFYGPRPYPAYEIIR